MSHGLRLSLLDGLEEKDAGCSKSSKLPCIGLLRYVLLPPAFRVSITALIGGSVKTRAIGVRGAAKYNRL